MGPDLDRILGLDPDPELGPEGRRSIAEGVRRRIADGALDELLDLDVDLAAPPGLGARVLEGVRGRLDQGPRVWRRRLAGGALLAAAAAALFMVTRPGAPEVEPSPPIADGAVDGVEAPSEELLAALVTLEDLAFLDAELEPIESDALFLLDEEDELLLDLLVDDE